MYPTTGVYALLHLPEPSRASQVVHIEQRNARINQNPPDRIPRPDRPARLVPVPRTDPLALRNRNLAMQQRRLRIRKRQVDDLPKLRREVRRRDRRHRLCDVRLGAAQQRQVRIVEHVPRLGRSARVLDKVLVGRVTRPDDGHRAGRHDGVGAAACRVGEPAAGVEGLEGGEDGGPGGRAVGLDVDEEVEGLAGGGVVDAVVGSAGGEELGGRVLAVQDGEDGVDVEGLEGAGIGEGGLLVADLRGSVVVRRLDCSTWMLRDLRAKCCRTARRQLRRRWRRRRGQSRMAGLSSSRCGSGRVSESC